MPKFKRGANDRGFDEVEDRREEKRIQEGRKKRQGQALITVRDEDGNVIEGEGSIEAQRARREAEIADDEKRSNRRAAHKGDSAARQRRIGELRDEIATLERNITSKESGYPSHALLPSMRSKLDDKRRELAALESDEAAQG